MNLIKTSTINKKSKIFSIVTPSFNHAFFIGQTIESVLMQKGKFFIDYIIMDGGSSDNTVEIIKNYEDKLNNICDIQEIGNLKFFIPRNNDCTLIQCYGVSFRWVSQKDDGQVDAINKGFKLAVGDIYGFLNSDDLYAHDKVFQKIIDKKNSSWDFIYGKGMWCSDSGDDLLLYPTYKPSKYSMKFQCTLCQPTVFFKKETYLELGEMSDEFHCAFDYEYWLRGLYKDKKYKFINSVLAKSRMYYDNKSLSGRDIVRFEVAELHKKYFNANKVHLIGFINWLFKITVQRGTVKRAQKLLSLMDSAKNQ